MPPTAIPTTFKEGGAWQLAKPADQVPRDAWWQVYRDPVLDKLEVQVAAANPNVAAAVARHDEAIDLSRRRRARACSRLSAPAPIVSTQPAIR